MNCHHKDGLAVVLGDEGVELFIAGYASFPRGHGHDGCTATGGYGFGVAKRDSAERDRRRPGEKGVHSVVCV